MRRQETNEFRSLELFCGAGGLSLGLEAAGFAHLALVEFNKHATKTIRHNRSAWPLHELDVRRFDFSSYDGRVNLLAAGAPCQPFSLGGQHRGDQDGRNMFPEVFRAIRATSPEAILIENVKGLTRESFGPYLEYIKLQLQLPNIAPKHGEGWEAHKRRLVAASARLQAADPSETYDVAIEPINCADYGTPQSRKRVIIVAFRRDLEINWIPPEVTHSEDALLYCKWVDGSYWREQRAKRKRLPDRLKNRISELKASGRPKGERWQTVRDALRGLPPPLDGVANLAYANHVGIAGARIYPGHTGSELDAPSKTVKAGVHGVPGGESIVILDNGVVRYLTVRETARIQCFPDDYEFLGCRGEAMRQIGNAVPVNVAAVFGAAIRRALENAGRYPRAEQTQAQALAAVSA